jgi:hypothetical protein
MNARRMDQSEDPIIQSLAHHASCRDRLSPISRQRMAFVETPNSRARLLRARPLPSSPIVECRKRGARG